MKILQIRLLVPNVRDCFLFYRDILDLEVLHGNEDTPYAEFRTGDIHIALEPLLASEPAGAPPKPHAFSAQDRIAIIIGVENVDAAYDRLTGKGIAFVEEPHDTPEWGHRVAYLRDPAGNLIELNGGL
ncbi:VOC family protein [Paenibacillus glycinis]|uniref:VOC family protein n=1 Tax=Paenibacillus glycinis TaxID=2697035 RepID=A0ABW9XZT8_9BACL|nr:VOC family protein [Paenibacillus glycinis]NBD27764.1 VOC family protein [Paenibacillus glycinis]